MEEPHKSSAGFPVKIAQIIKETSDVKTFLFEYTPTVNYSSGQYLTFIFTIPEKEIRRSYSICSSPLGKELLGITFRRIPNGIVSRLLFDQFQVGDILRTTGAGGFFVLPLQIQQYHHVFFFAAGTGIVPVFSILKSLLYEKGDVSAVLVYSSKSKQQCIYFQQLQNLQAIYGSRITIHFLFSNDTYLEKARLNNLFLEAMISQYNSIDLEKSLFFLCGPTAYMRMIEFELRTAGIEASMIRKEIFDTSKPLISSIPANIHSRQVEIHYKGNIHHIVVKYPVSILAQARKNNIDLPFSCEAGKCGNCAALCIKGKIWMLNNEVLTNQDVQKGFVLTCTGFPIEGDVIISF